MVSALIHFNSFNDTLWSINTEKTSRKSRRVSCVRARMMFVAVMAFSAAPQPIERSSGMPSDSLENLFAATGVQIRAF